MSSELVDYVFQQQKAGLSNEYIREQLRSSGWKEEQIAEAFNEAEELHEGRKWTTYSVASIILIFVASLSVVGYARVTGLVPGNDIACVIENPNYPGYYDFIESPDDCLQLTLHQLCNPLDERLAVESSGTVLFEGGVVCPGKNTVVYYPKE